MARNELGATGTDEDLDVEGAPARIPAWWGISAFVLSLLGLGEAIYLTIEHFQGGIPSCPATGVINCAKVTTSPQSYVLHIPVALLGLLFFVAMVVVNVPPLWRIGWRWVAWLRLAMVTTGLGMVVYLVAAEVFSIKAICLWCTGVHVITVALFVLVLATFPTVLGANAAAEDWAEWDPEDDADGEHAGSAD
ncbi:MAG TPA: vitamin K epoxide reductase family protein [Acidimicrobiales bacterium]|nr:vitamin K epoxide reductase family protein [Acidimicrobiales bacterium]